MIRSSAYPGATVHTAAVAKQDAAELPLTLLAPYLKRTVDTGSVYVHIRRGIPWGCALSPLIGAFYLETLDDALGRSGRSSSDCAS